jgi:predicted Zn-ribbon and HTH transcriptional regulator
MKLVKRNNKECELELIDGKMMSSLRMGHRDTIFFVCLKCGKQGSRRVCLWRNLDSLIDRDFYCQQCNREQNSLDLYGCKNSMGREDVREKVKNTNLERYGVDNPMKDISIAKKSGETRRKFTYDFRKNYTEAEIITDFSVYDGTHKTYRYKCKICGYEFDYNTQDPKKIPRCSQCISTNFSKPENDIAKFLEIFKLTIIRNSRNIIPPFELDIFIPDKNIGFEFDGFHWHGEQQLINSNISPRNYHLIKHKLCEEKGIFLINIFEDEWMNLKLRSILESRIRNIFKVVENRFYARNLLIKEITPREKNIFLEENHIQGNDFSNIKLGAFNNEKELLSVMTFSSARICMGGIPKDNVYELSRFAVKKNSIVVGAASKLLTYFIRNFNPIEVYSYSDKRWSKGDLYKTLGFVYSGTSLPSYWYFKNGRRFYRFNFRKSILKKFENYSNDKTEYQIMLENGYDRIWDCGHDKWVLNLSE